jgi:muconate cycloisomerase
MHDEGAWTPQDVLRISKHRAGDIISLYAAKPGGLWPAKKVAAVAEAAGFLCNVNGSAETGVGNAANLALAGSTPVVAYPCVIPVTRLEGNAPTAIAGAFYTDDLITQPFRYVDGALELPSGPGLGITVDQAKINRYTAE